MVISQTVNRSFDDVPYLDAFALTNVAKNRLEVVSNRTDKVNRHILVVVVTLDVYVNERLESFLQQ